MSTINLTVIALGSNPIDIVLLHHGFIHIYVKVTYTHATKTVGKGVSIQNLHTVIAYFLNNSALYLVTFVLYAE
jgi:hypothetical protein